MYHQINKRLKVKFICYCVSLSKIASLLFPHQKKYIPLFISFFSFQTCSVDLTENHFRK